MTPLRSVAVLALLSLGYSLPFALLAETPPLPPGVPAPIPADEAKKTFQLAPGLEIQLLAQEPMVRQPVCITFDDRGRLWVLQYLQYPIPKGLNAVQVDQYLRTKYDRVPPPPPKGPKGGDKIIILEDPDEEGRYRKTKEVITRLNLASGMALGYGGVFVVQPPYLLFYRLKPGTDEPDGDPEVLLKGFGMEDAHAFANSLTWGPDGWLYGAQGSTVTANIRGIEFQQGIWRYHPRTREFELFAEGGGNTWGIDFDRHGQLFAGGNTTEPLCHHVQGGYYIKGFGKHGPLHNPYSFGYFDPVKHRGYLGSALTGGFVIYRGGLLPKRFNDAVIYPNLRVNAMRVSRLEPAGSTFTTNFQEDFITSSDRWFRPVKSLVGPDGALTIADWYDYNISHSDPKDRSQWYQPSRDTGRIWRVFPQGTKPRATGKWPLSKLSNDELVDLLGHANNWYVREARRILMERRDPAIRPRLASMVMHEKDRPLALEALWALHVSGGLTDDLAMKFLDHPFEHVRAWTIRLLGDRRQVAPRFNDPFVELARREPSATVRSQLACTCKRLPGAVALPIVEQLLARAEDVTDLHIPLLLWWAIEDKAISDRDRVMKLVDSTEAWNRPITRAVVVERLARRYLAERTPAGYACCARMLGLAPTPAERERLVRALEQQMEGLHFDKTPEALASALKPLLAEEHPSAALIRLCLRLGLEAAYPPALARAADNHLGAEDRAGFIHILGELKRSDTLPALLRLLNAKEPAQVQTATLVAIQHYEAPEVAATVIEQYPPMTPLLRDKARDVLVSRSSWSAAALAAVEKGTIPAKDFRLDQIRRLVVHKDPKLNQAVEKFWGQVRPATSREKQGRITAVSEILAKGAGDTGRGKELVGKLCLNCHQLFGAGAKIGPDLTATDRKNLEVLLPNLIDPSAVIREGYQQYLVTTLDGRVLSGLLAENTAEKTTILDANGLRTTLNKKEIDSLTRAETSLMPEGILDPLSDQELRDLFAYLRSEPGRPLKDAPQKSNAPPKSKPPKRADGDGIPRLPAKEPAEAAKSFRTTDGFRMDLLAHEPLVTSPVAMAYDENGQAYVLEMRDYPYTDRNNDKPFVESTKDLPLGRVRLLRDRNGDGIFDDSVIFADNLSWPTGIACWKGGVYVAATPELIYLKDTDGDGKADVRQKVFTGFRKFNIQAVINNLHWGLDHRIYGAGGTNGGTIRSLLDAQAPAVTMRANDFRFDPRRPRFELLPGGQRFGMSFDDWGNRFLCNIRNPVIHVVLPEPSLARNPFLPIRSALNDAAATGDTLPVYRVSPSEPWRALRARRWTAEGQNMPRSELVADGYFTSACGITIYRGTAYPRKYWGNAFLSDVASNLIHREVLTPHGVTFLARRGEDKSEFVASTDAWFRPVNFVNAPDGTLHVVDMYREVIEHPWSIPDDIKAQLDLESGRDRGRIWRLTPPGFKTPPPPRLGKASTLELVECLENPNAWWRETAHRLIFERQDHAAIAPLRKMLRVSKSPLARLHALWSLQGLESLSKDDLLCALQDEAPGVREHGVRLAESRIKKDDPLRDRIVELSRDPEERVRFQVAFALGGVPEDRAIAALAAIARRDIHDNWLQLAVLSSTANRSDKLLRLLSKDRPFVRTRAGRGLMRRLTQIVGRRQDRAEVDEVLTLLAHETDASAQAEMLLGLGEGLQQRGKKLEAVLKESKSDLTHLLKRLLAQARATVADNRIEPDRRRQAALLLGLGDFAAARSPLVGLLDPRQPSSLQLDAVRVLSSFNDSRIPELLLASWPTYSPTIRAEVVQVLLSRPQWIGSLLDAIKKRQLSPADVPAARKALLLRHADAGIRARATALFAGNSAGPRKEVIARYEKALSLRVDSARGKLVFQKQCASCHRLGGEGFEVGPNLETVRHHAPSQILTSILDPNREVSPNYLEYLVTTKDGKTVSGIIVSETVTSLTLKRAGGVQETVLRQNIEEMTSTSRSLMPEGVEQTINPQEMADLVAFLLKRITKTRESENTKKTSGE